VRSNDGPVRAPRGADRPLTIPATDGAMPRNVPGPMMATTHAEDAAAGSPDRPPLRPQPWTTGVAPRYIALFLLAVYYDQLAPLTLAVGGLGPSLLGLLAAGVACYALLYRPAALWGLEARQPFERVARRTFGDAGAPWLAAGVLALTQVLWFAVAIFYAIELSFRALVAFGLLGRGHLEPISWHGWTLAGPLFLWVAAVWSLCSALIGTLTVRLVSAVMAGYQAFPALVLALAALWAFPAARNFVPLGFDPRSGAASDAPALDAALLMVQLVFGFFATHGALAVDWGMASRDRRDVRLGGWVGVALASVVLATLGLLIVAGANGRDPLPAGLSPAVEAQRRYQDALEGRTLATSVEGARRASIATGGLNFTVRGVLADGLGGWPGGLALLVLSLTLLGPACFTPYLIGRFLGHIGPRVPRPVWLALGALATWPIVALRIPARLDVVFGVLGALAAPLVGALAADRLRSRGAWPGPRAGVNLAGLLAWLVGLAVGLVPIVGPALGVAELARVQPAAVFAYLGAFAVYHLAAWAGLESRANIG
jgi:cytosine permease